MVKRWGRKTETSADGGDGCQGGWEVFKQQEKEKAKEETGKLLLGVVAKKYFLGSLVVSCPTHLANLFKMLPVKICITH